MSAYNPPSFIVTVYNPFFFNSTNSGNLTQTQANSLYLQKTVADTATSLETFTSGIATNSLNTTTSSSALQIVTGATSTGDVNIKTGLTSSGTVNIATGTGITQTTAVNIGSGSTTGAVTIGNSANNVNVNGNLIIGGSKNITLGNGTVVPTSAAQLGYLFQGGYGIPGIGSGALTQLNQITLPIGTWYVFYNASFTVTVANVTVVQMAIGLGTNTTGYNADNFIYGTNVNAASQTCGNSNIYNAPASNGSAIIQVTASTTYYLNFFINLVRWSSIL